MKGHRVLIASSGELAVNALFGNHKRSTYDSRRTTYGFPAGQAHNGVVRHQAGVFTLQTVQDMSACDAIVG